MSFMLFAKHLKRRASNIVSSNLKTQLTSSPKTKPDLSKPLLFGTATTDHILEIDWDINEGWSSPEIKPYGPLVLDPTCSVFHYATECFEGMKAYGTSSNDLLLFRPEMNIERLRRSAKAVGLPDFDGHELLNCMKEHIRVDREWIPKKPAFSLYIRPTMIGTHPQLGVVQSRKAKLFVVISPVGPYFPDGFVPVNLYCDDDVVRAWPGGSGDKKVGPNYGPAIGNTVKINALGYHQYPWLVNGYVTEMGTMNFFCLIKNEGRIQLVTTPLDSTILPGVTRDSVLQLTREWDQFEVVERKMHISELVDLLENQKVLEVFGTGTAAIVAPVAKIFYKGKDYAVPLDLGNSGTLTKRIHDHMLDIQHGVIKHPWAQYI